jgi:hypothetical protein
MHEHFPGQDKQIREWMAKQGWDVTRDLYNGDTLVFGWRHEKQGERSITLRVGQQAMEDWARGGPLIASLSLDALEVAKKLKASGDVLVKRTSDGHLAAELYVGG